MYLELEAYGEKYKLNIIIANYINNDNISLQLFDKTEGPFATITKNLKPLPKGYAFIDVNNCPWVKKLIEDYNLGTYANIEEQSGYVTYPLYKLNMDMINLYCMEVFNYDRNSKM